MENAIRSRFSNKILDAALSRYGIDRDTVNELKGFESFVYHCTHQERDRILRISHSLHRSAKQIASEIDWIAYLADNGVAACRAVPSLRGSNCEMLGEEDDHFTFSVFEKAPGDPPNVEIWQLNLFEKMGKLMGRMHVLTGKYVPGNTISKRPDWHEDAVGLADKCLPADQSLIRKKYHENLEATLLLPRSDDNFGLVHLDFHRGNFFVDDGKIHLFDFDDCQYSWFGDDIAMALFYAIPHEGSASERVSFAKNFLQHFLAGYRSEMEIEAEALQYIPLFLKRREMDIYSIIHRSMDLENLGPWATVFMKQRAEKIKDDIPYIDLDFSVFEV